jgi:hypothetical protein
MFIVIILLLLIFVFLLFKIENFSSDSIYNSRFFFNDSRKTQLKYKEKKINCCLVKKIQNSNSTFFYDYTKHKNNECNININELNNINFEKNQLFIDGKNEWSNENCSNDKSELGSCRNSMFECIDFVSEKECKKYNDNIPSIRTYHASNNNFTWNPKPCYQK